MLTKVQYAANEKYMSNTLNSIEEDGLWIYPNAGFSVKKKDGKFVIDTFDKLQTISGLVRKEWFHNNCVVRFGD